MSSKRRGQALRRAPQWVRRHPFLHAWWLQTTNVISSAGPPLNGPPRIWQAAVAILFSTAVIALFAYWWGAPIVTVAEEHLFTTGILLALLSSALTHLRRAKWSQTCRESWLSTTPVSRGALTRMIAWRSASMPLAILAAVCVGAELTAHLLRGSVDDPSALVIMSIVGTFVGVSVGWWLPRREPEIVPPTVARARGAARTGITLAGLSRWPLMQTRAWLQPRALARLMILALGLPMDIPANVAIAVLWLLIVGAYLVSLLIATIHVAKEGAALLRPTPLPFGRFAWAIARFSILKQLQWILLAAAVLGAMSSHPLIALRVIELWLAVASVVSSIGLTCAYHARGMGMKMLVSAGVLAILEAVRQHTALPCALLYSSWQLRRAVRS